MFGRLVIQVESTTYLWVAVLTVLVNLIIIALSHPDPSKSVLTSSAQDSLEIVRIFTLFASWFDLTRAVCEMLLPRTCIF